MSASDIHLTNAQIRLEGNKTKYQVGDYIHGKLLISLNGQLTLSMVRMGLTCVATIKAVDSSTMYQKDGKVCLAKNEIKNIILNHTYELPAKISANILRAGTHEIPFKFQLPESGIPSSFESMYGCICYFIEYIIGEDNRTHRSGCEITVEAPVRDNLYVSVSGSTEKDLGILCLGSGKVYLSTHLNKKGYLPVSVTPRATLYQTQVLMYGDKPKSIETQLSEPSVGRMVSAGFKRDDVLQITIPEDTALTMKSSTISVKYFIHVTLDIPYTIDLHLDLPIVITNKTRTQLFDVFSLSMGRIQLQEFEISLNGNKRVFKNGEQIDGFALIVFNGELDLKNVKIRLKGEAECKWTKTKYVTSSNDRQSRNITYEQTHNFLTESFDVTQTAKETLLQKGTHRIPFIFQLPEDVPNSFKSKFGQIRYWVEAEIEKAMLSWNHECQYKFSVCSPLKATHNEPVVYRRLSNYSCCFIKRGAIDLEISSHENTFSGGDVIPIAYDINNRRSFALKIKATLIEKHIFRAKNKNKNNQKVVTQKHIATAGPVIEAANQSVGVIEVPIPANTSPSVKSQLIEVNYFVHIRVDDKSSGLEFDFPVIILHTNHCDNYTEE